MRKVVTLILIVLALIVLGGFGWHLTKKGTKMPNHLEPNATQGSLELKKLTDKGLLRGGSPQVQSVMSYNISGSDTGTLTDITYTTSSTSAEAASALRSYLVSRDYTIFSDKAENGRQQVMAGKQGELLTIYITSTSTTLVQIIEKR